MKTTKKSRKADCYKLGDICAHVNGTLRARGLDAFMKGDGHSFLLLSGAFATSLAQKTRELERGSVAPFLSPSCCRDCFIDFFDAGLPVFGYKRCQPAVDADLASGEDPSSGPDIAVPATAVDGLDDNALFDYLVGRDDCVLTDEHDVVTDLCPTWVAYHRALVALVEAAAHHALRIGSASVRTFLEALRLLMPRDMPNAVYARYREALAQHGVTVIDANTAGKVYDLLDSAWATLWTDGEIRKMSRSAKAKKRD